MKWKQTGISLLLAVSLTASLAPVFGPALKAEAAEDRTIMQGTSGISSPSGSMPSDYIYFGTYNNEPVQWRVLDAEKGNATEVNDSLQASEGAGSVVVNDNAMFLLSEYLLEEDKDFASSSNAWQGSNAQGWCKKFYTECLTAEEKPAALLINKSDASSHWDDGDVINNDYSEVPEILKADKEDRFFYLSVQEADTDAYGFTDSDSRMARRKTVNDNYYWWLRSPQGVSSLVGLVTETGDIYTTYAFNLYGARPAFNLNRNSVLFTSAVGDGVDGETDEILKEIPTYNGKEWKLTLRDQNRSSFTANLGADKKTITYSGEKTGDNEYISAIVAEVKEGKEVYTHYARLKKVGSGDANKTVDVAIPFDMTGKKLYVFNEQCNDEKKTNYASKLKEITEATENAYTVNYEGMTALATTGGSWRWMDSTEDYTAQLQLAGDEKDNYILPTEVTVKVGEAPLTAGDDYTYQDGVLTIFKASIDGDITITANAVAKTYGLSITGVDSATGEFKAHAGYTSLPAAQTFQIENTGNQAVNNITVQLTAGEDFFTLNTTGGGGLPLTRERQQHLRYSRRGICREAQPHILAQSK